jgi:hypothetical protein
VTYNEPPGRFTRERLASIASPEAIAAILTLILVAGGLISVSQGTGAQPTGSVAAGPTASPLSAASAVIATSSPTVESSPTAPPTSTPTAEASPVATPGSTVVAWAATARSLLLAEDRLISRREELRTELAAAPKQAAELSRLLRSTNTTLQAALTSIQSLAEAGAPDPLVVRLLEEHEIALAAALKTLASSVQDVKAYKAGAIEMVAALEPLESLGRDLAGAAGLPDPYPDVTPAPSASGSPSAAP